MTNGYKKKPMSEKVYDRLKKEIMANELKPGEKLVEMEISKKLEVSRTPVREALKQLEQDGLVTYYPRKGSIVSQVSIQDALNFYQVREYLEGLAIREICLDISRKDMQILGDIIDKMDKNIEEENYTPLYNLHVDWTETIISFINNNYLKDQMINIFNNLERYRSVSLFSQAHIIEACKETKLIYEAIVDGDEDKSEKLARMHVRNARGRFLENIKESEKDGEVENINYG